MRPGGPKEKMHLPLTHALRMLLFFLLLVASAAVLYTTAQNARAVRKLAGQSLESTAVALSVATESALRAGPASGPRGNVREILSDRVVAYALISRSDGTIIFHTNPSLPGTRISDPPPPGWFGSGNAFGRQITLGMGLPAYEYNYQLQSTGGGDEFLRLVLHATPTDRITKGAERIWWTVGFALLVLWAVGILLERTMTRQFRLQAEADRRERMALIGQMTASLAHEIRNALGGVKGFAQLVDERTEEPDSRKKGLVALLRGIGRIEALVRDLLLFSREETFDVRPLHIAGIVREAVMADAAGWKGGEELELDPKVRAMGDREKVLRVLGNGIRNAIQSMGEEGSLRISARREGNRVAIRIEDTGGGVPESEKRRMFTPFHTTKTDGTGLGLAYSKKVIEGMGGTIDLANRDGGGAALSILLPCAGNEKDG